VQTACFTPDKEICAGWLKNCGMSGAGTVGQGAETMESYSCGRVGAHGWSGRRGWRVAVRARDGLAGGGNWGHALGDELRRRCGGEAGERTLATAAAADGSSAGVP